MNQHRRRIMLVGLVAGLCALVLAVAVGGSRESVCAGCHATESKALAAGPHAGTTCYRCHLTGGTWGIVAQKSRELGVMYPAALLGRKPDGAVRQLPRHVCEDCHDRLGTQVSVGRVLRIRHETCATGGSCDGCHAATAHGDATRWKTSYTMEDCTGCHGERQVAQTCETCHTGGSSVTEVPDGPWQVTHGKNWRRTHGMGDLDSCSTCHDPGVPSVRTGFCAKCHQVDVPHPSDFGGTHGDLALTHRESCAVCHKSEQLCDGCHQTEMPHPVSFAREHPTIADSKSDQRCVRCHEDNDCDACHASHVHPGGSRGVPVPWNVTNERQRSDGAR